MKAKLSILVASAALLALLAACVQPIPPPAPPQYVPQGGADGMGDAGSKPIYLFLENTFMGGLVDGEWRSVSKPDYDDDGFSSLLLKDVLTQDGYALYYASGTGTRGREFLRYQSEDFGLSGLQTEGAEALLAEHGEPYLLNGEPTGYVRYTLPLELDERFDEILIPSYNFQLLFPRDGDYSCFWDGSGGRPPLAINAEHDPFPRHIAEIEPGQDAQDALKALLDTNGLGGAYPHFTAAYEGDLDGDGSPEGLYFANSPRGEDGWPLLKGEGALGTYSAILHRGNDGAFRTVYEDMRPYSGTFTPDASGGMELFNIDFSTQLKPVAVADVNGDGVYEFGCAHILWEGGRTMLFSLGEIGYSAVLTANWGM
ncbi:MAG: hypothetical protein Q4D04_13390 [Clostridia bacterium]|nr:hypothetical protein [Clostridia bacterium]